MSQLAALIEACEVDTRKALRQGGKAISGTLPSWSRLAKECLSTSWTEAEEKQMVEWGAAWSEKIKKHDPLIHLFWSAWSCTVNADLQQTGDPKTPYFPFASCQWLDIDLPKYKRWVEGVLGKDAVYAWLSASDEHKQDHVWWATPSAKTMLKNNTQLLTWVLDNTMDIPVPMMKKVWKGLGALQKEVALSRSRDPHGPSQSAITQIERWSEVRVKNGLEPLDVSSLILEQPLSFWKQVLGDAAVPGEKHTFWISPHVDKELIGFGADHTFEKWNEKWDWLKSQSKWCKALMHKPGVLARFKSSWPEALREEWAVEIEKSALAHNKKQVLNKGLRHISDAL